MSEKKNTPNETSFAYDIMAPRWKKMSTVVEGTEAMRRAGEHFLPRHPAESRRYYTERLQRAVLFNVLQLTLEGMVGLPFSDDVVVNEDVPQQMIDLFDDVDLQGNDLTTFCREVFREGLLKSFTHVLVDFPTIPEGDVPRTLADDRRDALRPYWVHIAPEDVIFANADIQNGQEILTHVRIQEQFTIQEGFVEKEQIQIRVLDLVPEGVSVRIFQPTEKKDEWIQVSSWVMDIDRIPLVTFYANRLGFMVGKPPLQDLADLNIMHWQSNSDQEHALTACRFPILAASGVPATPSQEMKDARADENLIEIGPFQILHSTKPDAKFYYVEHSGSAIAAGAASIAALEDRMAEFGAQFLKKRPGNMTATARALDSAEASSPLQDVSNRFMSSMQQVLLYTARWLRKDDGGTLTIPTDFGPEDFAATDQQILVAARSNRDISRIAFLEELRRRGILAEDYDAELDKELIEDEQPPTLDLDPQQEDEDEEDDLDEDVDEN